MIALMSRYYKSGGAGRGGRVDGEGFVLKVYGNMMMIMISCRLASLAQFTLGVIQIHCDCLFLYSVYQLS